MTVIVSRTCIGHPGPDASCSLCNGYLHPPFVTWTSELDLRLCANCCSRCGPGLMADIVHANAISEIHRLGYSDTTLHRSTGSRRRIGMG